MKALITALSLLAFVGAATVPAVAFAATHKTAHKAAHKTAAHHKASKKSHAKA
jgi:hypothetical protein